MGAMGTTTRGVKKAARAGKTTVHATVSWPFALLFGPLYDLRLRRKANEDDLSPLHASTRRSLEGATGARWTSAIICIAVLLLLAAFGGWVVAWVASFSGTATAQPSVWLFTPLIPVARAVYVRRAAWWKGRPTLRRMVSMGGWVVTGLSLIPVTVMLFEMLFEPFDPEVHGWLIHGSAWLAAGIGFISALNVAERLKKPEQSSNLDVKDSEFMASLVGMNRTALDAAVEKKAFDVGRSGDNLYAVYPLGVEAKFNRVAIEAVLAERGAQWEIAALDYEERRLTLERPSDATKRKREALALSGGLVDDLLDEHEDDGQSSVGLDWGRFN